MSRGGDDEEKCGNNKNGKAAGQRPDG